MGYVTKVPTKFGALALNHALYFGCQACSRGVLMERPVCIRRWGEEGSVAAVARRFRCSNCSAKRKGRKPGVTVEVVRQYRTASELARGELGDPDTPANDP